MRKGVSWWRHLFVFIAIATTGVLARGCNLNDFEGEYDQVQLVVQPVGGTTLEVTEVLDLNTGRYERHGIARKISDDLGDPINVSASSDNPNDTLSLERNRDYVRITYGNRKERFVGVRRYQLTYQLPEVDYRVGSTLSIELVERLNTPVGEFRGVLTGFELSNPRCEYGVGRDTSTCMVWNTAPGVYEVRLNDLGERDAVRIGGTVERLTTSADVGINPVVSADQPVPDDEIIRAGDENLRGLTAIIAGILGAIGTYLFLLWRGRNQVRGATATEAAFAPATIAPPPGPPPGPPAGPPASPSLNHQSKPVGNAAGQMMTDSSLARWSTTEFQPPPGVAPWEASLLMYEEVRDRTAYAYIAGLAIDGTIQLTRADHGTRIARGPNYAHASAADREFVEKALELTDPSITRSDQDAFNKLLIRTRRRLIEQIRPRQWWRAGTKLEGVHATKLGWFWPILVLVSMPFGIGIVTSILGSSVPNPYVPGFFLGIATAALTAFYCYGVLLPSRSPKGSAMALRIESFRRFLHYSEAHHVDQAAKNGQLREYSLWAYALGESDHWSLVLHASAVPDQTAAEASWYFDPPDPADRR